MSPSDGPQPNLTVQPRDRIPPDRMPPDRMPPDCMPPDCMPPDCMPTVRADPIDLVEPQSSRAQRRTTLVGRARWLSRCLLLVPLVAWGVAWDLTFGQTAGMWFGVGSS
jgi:hypothetical protein